MKVQLTKVVLDKEVDVTLPLYRKQDLRGDDGMGTVIFMRVDQPGPLLREVSIAITDDVKAEISINHDYRFDRSASDYLLGLGDHACTEEEFNEARGAALIILNGAW